MIHFQCPTCHKNLKAHDQGVGRKTHCPRCGQRLLVPPPIPTQARNKTIMGQPAPSPPEWLDEIRAAEAKSKPLSATPQPSGDVPFECPICHSPLNVAEQMVGHMVECPKCRTSFAALKEETIAERTSLTSSSNTLDEGIQPGRGANFARCALACAGALLLLIGQFCPMLRAQENVSVSFFDYSMKGAWLLSKAAVEAMDYAAGDSGIRQRPEDSVRLERLESWKSQSDRSPSKPSDGLRLVALSIGLVLTLISPFCPLILVAIAVFVLRAVVRELGQAATTGMRAKMLTIAGVFCLAALGILYFGPMLVLWSIPGVLSGIAFNLISFGFGWGVLLFGSFLLLLGGAIR